jgi:hypothetical protein
MLNVWSFALRLTGTGINKGAKAMEKLPAAHCIDLASLGIFLGVLTVGDIVDHSQCRDYGLRDATPLFSADRPSTEDDAL